MAVGFRSGVYLVSADGAELKTLHEQGDVPRGISYAAIDRTGRLAVAAVGPQMADSWLGVWDLEAGTMRRFPRPPMSKTFRLAGSAFGYDGKLFLPGAGGIHRWDVETGEHKLFFETREAGKFAVSADGEHLLATRGTDGADGRTIASSAEDETVRLWPMPDLSKPPLHTLPRADLITKLKSLTNVRAVPDKNSDTGYRVGYDPFPGWERMPTW